MVTVISFFTKRTFALPSLQSEKFYHNASLLDAGLVQQTAAMLANATLHTDKYYGSDVKVVYRLMQSLLQHESNQRGFNLTATQDVHFTEVTRYTQTPPQSSGTSALWWELCCELIRPVNRTSPASRQSHTFLPAHHTSVPPRPPHLCHPVTPTSRCLLTESGPREQRHPVSRHTATLGAHPAL